MPSIRLTSYLQTADADLLPGTEIEITDENADLCKSLLANHGAVTVRDPAENAADHSESDGDSGDSDDDPELAGLDDNSPITVLADHGIHGRYIAALTDAGLTTIAQVRAAADLSKVPGISHKAAADIAAVLT